MPLYRVPFPRPAVPTVRRQFSWASPRPPSAPVGEYTTQVTSLPIPNGQALGKISAAGTATLQAGPAGLGTVWFPASAVISTTTGVLDSSTCTVYVGAAGLPTTLQGTLFPGGAGTVALAIPSMTPGLYVIAEWTGGNPGDTCSLNITGTMNALTRKGAA